MCYSVGGYIRYYWASKEMATKDEKPILQTRVVSF